jgi:hypothetical protein
MRTYPTNAPVAAGSVKLPATLLPYQTDSSGDLYPYEALAAQSTWNAKKES